MNYKDNDFELIRYFQDEWFTDSMTYKNKKTGIVCDQTFDVALPVREGFGTVLNEDKWTYFEPATEKLCKQEFFSARSVREGFGTVLIVDETKNLNQPGEDISSYFNQAPKGKWTYFNPTTEKLCEQTFDYAGDLSEGFGVVQIGDKFKYFNPSTEKLCVREFDDARAVHNGYGRVRIGDKWAYYNPRTGKLCDQMFDYVFPIENGLGVVQIGDKGAFFNPKTEKICGQMFDYASEIEDGISLVMIEDKEAYYTPSTKKIFGQGKATDSIEDYLRENPNDFLKLPTQFFKNKEKVKSCLKAIGDGLCYQESDSPRKLETDFNGLYLRIEAKIEKEYGKIKKEKYEKSKKDKIAKDYGQKISNLYKDMEM